MRFMNWKTVSTLAAMFVVAGCRETAVSPIAGESVVPAPIAFAPEGRPLLSLNGAGPSETSAEFNISPRGGVYQVGNHAVVFPAKSICDPATSSYGIGTWDDACVPLTRSIRITAQVRVIDGKSWVDFSPSLRFVPSNNPARWVWMYMYTPGATNSFGLRRYNILYAPVIGGPTYDESLDDPTLRTYVGYGVALRRIKHFSGYTSSTGLDDPCTLDPTAPGCVGDPNGGVFGRLP
jgi:hypothetical protein